MLRLRAGASVCLEITQADSGVFRLALVSRVGSGRPKTLGTPKILETEEELWIELSRWADDRLAALGLEKTKA